MLRVLMVVCVLALGLVSPTIASADNTTVQRAPIGTTVKANSSYYDEKGKPLADGTCFKDVMDVAAGSPTLKNTIVKVTNPDNGATIERVYIRDVHGSCSSRDICLDMTPSAARQLGFLVRGRLPLTVTVVGHFPFVFYQGHTCGPTQTVEHHRPRQRPRTTLASRS